MGIHINLFCFRDQYKSLCISIRVTYYLLMFMYFFKLLSICLFFIFLKSSNKKKWDLSGHPKRLELNLMTFSFQNPSPKNLPPP